jgi:ubiquinone/menaquinone biosynthesis C-methylase UbiE
MSFDLLAPHYTWMERVLAGPRLQRARTAWLDVLAPCRAVLVAGVGHGHFVARAAQRFPQLQFTCVDASAGMLRQAAARTRQILGAEAAARRVAFVHGALPAWAPPAACFDAIVTHFFLDCFAPAELGPVVETLARAARGPAVWLLADFAIPPGGLARQRARCTHALMYAFFRRVTRIGARRLTEPDPWLTAGAPRSGDCCGPIGGVVVARPIHRSAAAASPVADLPRRYGRSAKAT